MLKKRERSLLATIEPKIWRPDVKIRADYLEEPTYFSQYPELGKVDAHIEKVSELAETI